MLFGVSVQAYRYGDSGRLIELKLTSHKMKILARIFKSLSAKILASAIFIIILCVTISVFVSQEIAKKELIVLLEDEMHGYLKQADSLTNSIGDFWKTESFDKQALLDELNTVGAANYRDTRMYEAIPVVAAWEAVRAAATDSGLEFRVVRENPRHQDNAPRTRLEREIVEMLDADKDMEEYFVIDEESGLIAYATPVVMEQSCLVCHGDPANSPTGDGKDVMGFAMENWRAGEHHGAYILTAPIEKIDKQVEGIRVASFKWAPFMIVIVTAFVYFGVSKLNGVLAGVTNQILKGADEVSLAAGEVSNASQTLAEGASEQAASLEETSSSMEEMKGQVIHNSGVAKDTAENSRSAAVAANEGGQAMQQLRLGVDAAGSSANEMNVAMQEIKESSDSISKIIKTIDEIAFQTNILALNAAVEAARAGEAGAGFAVVADEVRSLAGRAADAAGETTKIIEDSISRTENGVRANQAVVSHLNDVMDRAAKVEAGLQNIDVGVGGVNSAMQELEHSVDQQTAGIDEINTALSQINDVTQTNAAAAEEAASASEEMTAQALELKNVITDLQDLIHGSASSGSTASAFPALSSSPDDSFKLPG